jgi:hypothetical protein
VETPAVTATATTFQLAIEGSGATFHVDSVIVELASTYTGYFDGNTPDAGGVDYAWTGTANASTSTATGTTTVTFADIAGAIPKGGTTGQILSKINGTDYNTEWVVNRPVDYETTVTSASTKTLTKDSPRTQFFTGSASGQVVVLPDTSTLRVGDRFEITNLLTTANVRIDSFTSVLLLQQSTTTKFIFTCVSTADNTAASWSRILEGSTVPQGVSGTGSIVLQSSSSINNATIGTPALTLSTTASTTRLSVTGQVAVASFVLVVDGGR